MQFGRLNGKRISSTGNNDSLKLWNPEAGQEIANLDIRSHGLLGVAFSADGNRIAVVEFELAW